MWRWRGQRGVAVAFEAVEYRGELDMAGTDLSRSTGLGRLERLAGATQSRGSDLAGVAGMFDALREKKPVAVVADQLFQTPRHIARMMAEQLSGVGRMLEPSAGLGRLIAADAELYGMREVVAVDVARQCVGRLSEVASQREGMIAIEGDFLDMSPAGLGMFDDILMNPPFRRGSDVRHIQHAMTFLREGGTLVALCCDGAAQGSLVADADHSQLLPAGTFREAGTMVGVWMLVFKK